MSDKVSGSRFKVGEIVFTKESACSFAAAVRVGMETAMNEANTEMPSTLNLEPETSNHEP